MKIQKYLEEDPLFILISLAKELSLGIEDRLQSEGLTYKQSLFLASLFFEKNEHLVFSEVAKAFKMSKGNMSHIISALEAKGYLQRISQKKDKRLITIRLTKSGNKVALRIVTFYERLNQKTEKLYGPIKIKKLILACTQYTDTFSKII